MKQALSVTFKSALFIALLGIIAFLSGNPFIFPSLGPTAYILAFDRKMSHSASVVIGGHACGIAGGLAGYYLFTSPHTLMTLSDPFSSGGLFLALGAILAVAITAFLMIWLQISHPPACATTLIISLGILPRPGDAAVILMAVTIMYVAYRIYQAVFYPYSS